MSDFFHVLYCPQVNAAESEEKALLAISALQQIRLIESHIEKVEGSGIDIAPERGHPLYHYSIMPVKNYGGYYQKSDVGFVNPNDLSVSFGRSANMWSVNSATWHGCPACKKRWKIHIHSECDENGYPYSVEESVDNGYPEIIDRLMEAAIQFIREDKAPIVECLACKKASPAMDWASDVPLAVSHLALNFHNWPLFKSDLIEPPDEWDWTSIQEPWTIDVPKIIAAAIGGRVAWSFGRI